MQLWKLPHVRFLAAEEDGHHLVVAAASLVTFCHFEVDFFFSRARLLVLVQLEARLLGLVLCGPKW